MAESNIRRMWKSGEGSMSLLSTQVIACEGKCLASYHQHKIAFYINDADKFQREEGANEIGRHFFLWVSDSRKGNRYCFIYLFGYPKINAVLKLLDILSTFSKSFQNCFRGKFNFSLEGKLLTRENPNEIYFNFWIYIISYI